MVEEVLTQQEIKIEEQLNKYLANPRLRRAGSNMNMSEKQLVEFMKCKKDPVYFIERYIKIVHPDDGLIRIKLYPKQKEMVELCHANRKTIIKAARQVGKTTTIAVGYLLYYILFNKSKTVGVLANKESTAIEILSRLKIAYMNLPLWIQQGIAHGGWNKSSIDLENGSRVLAGSTSSAAIRGWTLTLLYLDEFAFVPPHVANDFFASVYPTLSSGRTTKIIITSTPQGMNLFYKLCMGALHKIKNPQDWNGFEIREYDWTMVPWRDEAWARDQRSTLGEEKFEQEFLCHFIGSAGTLISGKILRTLEHIEPIQMLLDNKYYVYSEPIPNTPYMIVVDTSHGKDIDESAFLVMDISSAPYKIAAKYASSTIEPEVYPNLVVAAAKRYNDAYIMAENNDMGALVLKVIIDDLEYENIIYSEDKKSKEKEISDSFGRTAGVRTTPKTKRQGCLTMKSLVENQQIVIQDFQIIEELSTFVRQKNNTYSAAAEKLDDLVMCLVIFAWCTTQSFFKDITNSDMRRDIASAHAQRIEDALPPAPIMADEPAMPKNAFVEAGQVWEIVGPADSGEVDNDHAWHGRYTGY